MRWRAFAPAGGAAAGGVLLYAVATVFSSAKDAGIKLLSPSLPVSEILSARLLGDLIPVLTLLALSRGAGLMRPRQWPLHLARAACMTTTMLLLYLSIRRLPLAQAIALFMMGPVFLAVLSPVLHRERVGLLQGIAVLLGLAGALIVIEPGFSTARLVHLLPLIAALTYAFVQLLSRELAKENSSIAITFYGSLGLVALLSLGTSSAWIVPTAGEGWALAAVAVAGGLSSLLYVAACRRAPLPVLAPVDYLGLIWAGSWGYLVWAEVPKSSLWLGGSLIVMALALSSRAAFQRSAEDTPTLVDRGHRA